MCKSMADRPTGRKGDCPTPCRLFVLDHRGGTAVITQKELKDHLCYDAYTGEFRWKKRGPGVTVGNVAGTRRPNSTWKIRLKTKSWLACDLAILYVTGSIPDGVVYHKNGNTIDNRFDNLGIVKMPKKGERITQEQLHSILDYNPGTGIFRWRASSGHMKAGKVAGTKVKNGYLHIVINRKHYYAHRLAWMYIHGYFPEHDIDHLNGDRTDNRITNLREVSRGCNMQNAIVRSNNKSGFPGVHWDKRYKRWLVYISVHKKRYHIGYFDSLTEAAFARLTAEINCPGWTCNHRSEIVQKLVEQYGDWGIKL